MASPRGPRWTGAAGVVSRPSARASSSCSSSLAASPRRVGKEWPLMSPRRGCAPPLLVYLLALCRSGLARRLFAYHGAEHMAIAAFERAGRMPDYGGGAAESPMHVRCGTDFIALFVIVAGIVFSLRPARSLVGRRDPARRAASGRRRRRLRGHARRCARRADRSFARLVTLPGRAAPAHHHAAPDDAQLEVALQRCGQRSV